METENGLIGLSYCSTATFDARRGDFGVNPEVNRILVHSRRNNRKREIGGVLHFGEGFFFQYLEGPADVVDQLYATICRDERHEEVRQLTRRPIRSRRFQDWSMKFVAIERVVNEVVRRHQLDRFNPYQFTPALIDDLVVSFVQTPNVDGEPEPRVPTVPRRQGFFQRMFRKS